MAAFFQAEDGIRDVERSRGLGDVYKRQKYMQFLSCDLRKVFWSTIITIIINMMSQQEDLTS